MTETKLPDGRRYQILDVIGRGGFGNVYRARLEGGDGFFKDVAVKIARSPDAPAEALQRFRDEARILGLIRDRALVDVNPPVLLDGRWAVVMEFVDGASCGRLVTRYGKLPPTVVMEIGAEIARVLHKIYKHPGRDGMPLRLVHRDIKPANIQITPTGEVKLLDFGIARAEFRDRESVTVMSIGGTRGYIAPERATGLEAPSGDVYSLGVVLYKLLCGKLPDDDDLGWEAGDPEPTLTGPPLEQVLRMAHKMRGLRPNSRPTAEQVHEKLLEMRRFVDGPSLEDWSIEKVPAAVRLAEDSLVGTLLTEGDTTPVPGASTSRWLGPTAMLLAGALVAGAVWLRPETPTASTEPVLPQVVEGPLEGPEVLQEPEPVVRTPAPAARPVKVVDPAAPVVLAPVPAPKEPVAERLPVRITSIPMGAEVRIDGRVVGTTPQLTLTLTPGPHVVEIRAAEASIRRKIEVGEGNASRFVWRTATGSWEEGF